MLRRLRIAPTVRLALCVAILLAVGASFGLHPEPGFGVAPRSASLAKYRAVEAAHGCVACLTHGAALFSLDSAIVSTRPLGAPVSPALDPPWRGRLAGTDLPGRSPPSDRS